MKPNPQSTASAIATFRRYGPELHQFLLRRIGREHEVEDVVQEVFLRLLRIGNSDFVRNPRAYIYGIALHVVREFRMRAVKAGTWATLDPQDIVDLAEEPSELNQDELAEQLDIQQQLERALRRLPTAHRTVFLLHKRDGYSYEEIAQQLSISVHTVDKYLLQAKVRIRAIEWDR